MNAERSISLITGKVREEERMGMKAKGCAGMKGESPWCTMDAVGNASRCPYSFQSCSLVTFASISARRDNVNEILSILPQLI